MISKYSYDFLVDTNGEDVCPKTRGFVCEMDEGEVGGFALGAYERVVGDVGEVALNGSFVGKYHTVLI